MSKVERAFKIIEKYVKEKKCIFNKQESVRLGMFIHLVLDCDFFEGYMYTKVKGNFETYQIEEVEGDKAWSPNEFFKRRKTLDEPDGVLYASYTKLNHDFYARGLITKEEIDSFPESMPLIGIEKLDGEVKRKLGRKNFKGI